MMYVMQRTTVDNTAKEAHAKKLYRYIKARVRYASTYRDRELTFTQDEFLKFLRGNKQWDRIYGEWVKSNFYHRLSPSVDRIDNSKGYEIKNIQIITRYENRIKGAAEATDPKLINHIHQLRVVFILFLKFEGYNHAEISNIVGGHRSSILRTINSSTKEQRRAAMALKKQFPLVLSSLSSLTIEKSP